jgi:hypothetical protein
MTEPLTPPDLREPPYPADTRARGWRFELDYEQIEQSDTWDLAAELPMAQHALLMMWLVAWKQDPCGSLPADEDVIRAKCKIPPAIWAKVRAVLMRGWWPASDGRLYHDTLTKRVREMLEYRRKNADRVAKFKAAKREQQDGNALPTGESRAKNDTGTGTGTGTSGIEPGGSTPPGSGATHSAGGEYIADDPIPQGPTAYGEIAGAIRRAGLPAVDSGFPAFRTLVDAGAAAEEFTAFVPAALLRAHPFTWLIGAVAGERKRAKTMAGDLHRGAMPNKQEALENRNRSVADEWAQEAANGSR